MANKVYFVTALTEAEKVAERLYKAIPDDSMRYEVAPGKWFVAFDGIANDLAEKIGIRTESPIGTGIVLALTGYSGRAPQPVWDWINLRTSAGT